MATGSYRGKRSPHAIEFRDSTALLVTLVEVPNADGSMKVQADVHYDGKGTELVSIGASVISMLLNFNIFPQAMERARKFGQTPGSTSVEFMDVDGAPYYRDGKPVDGA